MVWMIFDFVQDSQGANTQISFVKELFGVYSNLEMMLKMKHSTNGREHFSSFYFVEVFYTVTEMWHAQESDSGNYQSLEMSKTIASVVFSGWYIQYRLPVHVISIHWQHEG